MKILFLILIIISLGSCGVKSQTQKKSLCEDSKVSKITIYGKDTANFFVTECYTGGGINKKGPMKDSVVVGYWEYYFENGKLKQKGNYVIDDSLNKGNLTYSYQRVAQPDYYMCSVDYENWERQNLHVCKQGYWEFYHPNGQVKAKGDFENGWSVGKWYEYSSTGQILVESFFKNTKRDSIWKYWYPNGQLMKIVDFSNSSEKLIEAYNEDGTQLIINGNGEFKQPDPNNEKEWFVATYFNGVLNGPYKKYFDNGKLEEEGNYKDGEREGTWTTNYFYYGVWLKRDYHKGEPHGNWYEFYTNGDTIEIKHFIDGKENGIFRSIDKFSKKTTHIEPWKMGKRHGIRKFYDDKGKLEECEYWYEDDIVCREFYKNGKMTEQKIFEDGEDKFKILKK